MNFASVSWVSALLIGGPQGEIVTQELHDESGVFVRILGDIVKLSNRVFERSACHLASLLGLLQNFVLKDRVIQCKAKTDWVSHSQVFLSDCLCICICSACALGCFALLIPFGELSDVTVVVGLHLLVENLRLAVARLRDEVSVQDTQDGLTNLVQFCLNFSTILLGIP